MKAEQKEFFDIMTSFRKLNISSMLPEISHGDFSILKVIHCCRENCSPERQGVKVSDVVKRTMLPAPAVSRSLRTLEEKELVVRTVDREDRRNTFVEITPAGDALLREIEEIMTSFADAVFGNLGEETIRKLNSYLQEFLEAARKEIDKRKRDDKKGEKE